MKFFKDRGSVHTVIKKNKKSVVITVVPLIGSKAKKPEPYQYKTDDMSAGKLKDIRGRAHHMQAVYEFLRANKQDFLEWGLSRACQTSDKTGFVFNLTPRERPAWAAKPKRRKAA